MTIVTWNSVREEGVLICLSLSLSLVENVVGSRWVVLHWRHVVGYVGWAFRRPGITKARIVTYSCRAPSPRRIRDRAASVTAMCSRFT